MADPSFPQRSKPTIGALITGITLVLVSLALLVSTVALVTYAQVFPAVLAFAGGLAAGLFGVTALLGRPFEEPTAADGSHRNASLGVVWFISTMLAVVVGFAGIAQLFALPVAVRAYAAWQYPTALRWIIASVEILGAIGLLIPRLATLSAALLVPILIGATYTLAARGPASLTFAPVLVLVGVLFVGWERSPFHRSTPRSRHARHA